MAYKISGFVEEKEVPRLRRQGNSDVSEIVQQLIAEAEAENTKFAFIPVPEKQDRIRLGNSIRNQVKLRGYDYEKVSGSKLRRFKGGRTELTEGIYVRAIKPAVESPAPRRRTNNKVA
jgi:hypothetical protein